MLKQKSVDGVAMARSYPLGVLYRQALLVVSLALVLCMGFAGTASAVSVSENYKVTETQFGSGSSLNDCSEHYCARTSAGDITVGTGSSESYSAQFGSNTTNEPLLEVIVAGGNQDMGTLGPTTTGTAVSTVAVRSYLSSGYTMQIAGAPPTQGTHALTALATPSTSNQGAEQFGINLALNTAPAMGAIPVHALANGSGNGEVADDYSTPDLFKYIEGDVIALSDASSSETTYTMSMIINVSNVTPGGRYTGTFSAVVVPLY